MRAAHEELWKDEVGSHGERGENTMSLAGEPNQETIQFSAELLHAGTNRISVTAISGSFLLYDAVTLIAPAATSLVTPIRDLSLVHSIDPLPLVEKRGGGLFQPVKVTLFHVGEERSARLDLPGADSVELPSFGCRTFPLGANPTPSVQEPVPTTIDARDYTVTLSPDGLIESMSGSAGVL